MPHTHIIATGSEGVNWYGVHDFYYPPTPTLVQLNYLIILLL